MVINLKSTGTGHTFFFKKRAIVESFLYNEDYRGEIEKIATADTKESAGLVLAYVETLTLGISGYAILEARTELGGRSDLKSTIYQRTVPGNTTILTC